MKFVAIALIVILSAVNALLLMHIRTNNREAALKEKYSTDDKFILENKLLQQVKSDNDRIAAGSILKDENRDPHVLADLVKDKEKIVLRFTGNNCENCVELMFKQLSDSSTGFNREDVLVLVSYSNLNSLQLLQQKYAYTGHIYNIDEKEMARNNAEKLGVPYFFVVRADGTERMVFFPEGTMPELTGQYLKVVSEWLHKPVTGN